MDLEAKHAAESEEIGDLALFSEDNFEIFESELEPVKYSREESNE